MNNKMFSIIVPAYNCEELIKDTLESIIQQSEELYECIVVDGLSEDNTMKVVQQYSNSHDNIRYISEKDKGIYDAMNKGIDLAKGEYLYFIGAGDRLFNNVLKKIDSCIYNEDFIYGNTYLDFEGRIEGKKVTKSNLIYGMLCHQGIFYRRRIFEIVGKYDIRYKIVADNILNKKIFANDTLIKKYVDIDIANYLGEGASHGYHFRDEFKDKEELCQLLVNTFGKEYLKCVYKNLSNIKNKKIIAWGTGGEYINTCKYKKFNIEYFVQSKQSITEFEGKTVKSCRELLKERKNDILIFVYSECYYNEIRSWLEKEGFEEFKQFILLTQDIVCLLKYIEYGNTIFVQNDLNKNNIIYKLNN